MCRGPFRDCFLVGALNRPRKRKRTNRENPRSIPEQMGKIPEKSGKSQKGQKRTKKEGQVQIGKPPRLKPPRLAALENYYPINSKTILWGNSEFQTGLEVCYCPWGVPSRPRLGPILGPSRSHPGSEVVPSRFAMCFVLQCFGPIQVPGGHPGPSWSHPAPERSLQDQAWTGRNRLLGHFREITEERGFLEGGFCKMCASLGCGALSAKCTAAANILGCFLFPWP